MVVRARLVASVVAAGLVYGGTVTAVRVATASQEASTSEPARATGVMTARHALPGGVSEATEAFVRAVLQRKDEVAGVRHEFVAAPGTLSAETAAAITAAGATLRTDTGDASAPTTVLTSADGAEVFRRVGRGAGDFITLDEFVRRASEAGVALTQHYNLPKGSRLAIEGYDPVAYFGGKAERGKESIVSRHRGVEYRFTSVENRAKFAADPDRYEPTYGGWCASAMGAKGEKVEIDPKNFKIKDGRLHLFYKDVFSDALKDWNKHEREWEPAADANWMRLTGETPRKPTAKE